MSGRIARTHSGTVSVLMLMDKKAQTPFPSLIHCPSGISGRGLNTCPFYLSPDLIICMAALGCRIFKLMGCTVSSSRSQMNTLQARPGPDARPSSRTRMRGGQPPVSADGDRSSSPSLRMAGTSSPVPARQHSPLLSSSPTTPQETSPVSIRYVGCAHSDMVLASLNDLRIHRELCDVELIVDDVRIPAHKSILCACSPYFKAMFTSSYSESSQGSVVIREVSSTALELLVQYFYTSEVYITTENVQELLSASCMFQIMPLKDACCEFMRRHLGVTNCLGVRAMADLHSCAQLKKIAEDFAKKNFASVIESEEFLKLEVEHLIDLFSSDELVVSSEEKVYEAVMIWIQHDPVKREEYLIQLLEKVSHY